MIVPSHRNELPRLRFGFLTSPACETDICFQASEENKAPTLRPCPNAQTGPKPARAVNRRQQKLLRNSFAPRAPIGCGIRIAPEVALKFFR